MKLFIAILLNMLLLTAIGWWLRCAYRRAGPTLQRWLLPTLALRVAAGLSSHGLDSEFALRWGKFLTAQFWEQPGAAWALWQGHELHGGGPPYMLYEWSNTLFIIKIVGILNLASLGSYWLTSIYLSVGSFMGCWLLVCTLGQLFPAASSGAGVVAFLLWPSTVWWASGITKETLVLGSGAALTALVMNAVYGAVPQSGWARLRRWLWLGLLAWLHVRMRYFFALPLLGSLLALVGTTLAQRRGWLRAGWLPVALAMLAGVVAAGTVAVGVGGEPVSKAFVTSQLWQSYVHGLATSTGRPHLVYRYLQPTVSSMASYFPLAAAQTLVRPWLGESALPRYVGVGLENILLVSLLICSAVAVVRGRPGRLPPALVLALLLYCLLLAGLIGLSTPNLGTLHRYRAVLLPWLLWLLLQPDYARRLLRRLKIGS
ncbi:MAG: hypothetical protein EOO59_08370 [Hymenobacter sp.]|nr:MAG: hypothetical protein EOO59_08370 [Hymenobacter sp.]